MALTRQLNRGWDLDLLYPDGRHAFEGDHLEWSRADVDAASATAMRAPLPVIKVAKTVHRGHMGDIAIATHGESPLTKCSVEGRLTVRSERNLGTL